MDRNSFHLAQLEASGTSQSGMAVAYEFHETSRGANYPASPNSAAMEPQYLIRMKSARSTEFPLKRLAVRSCFPPTVFVILTNQKCQSYQLSGKTPSNMTCSAGNELRVSMDGADDLSALSIPGPGCVPRQSSCYGRCFARSVEPDAALWLMRRKRGASLPRPQSASDMRSGVICNPPEHKSVRQIQPD